MGRLEETQEKLLVCQSQLDRAREDILELNEKAKEARDTIGLLKNKLSTEKDLAETEKKIQRSTILSLE